MSFTHKREDLGLISEMSEASSRTPNAIVYQATSRNPVVSQFDASYSWVRVLSVSTASGLVFFGHF